MPVGAVIGAGVLTAGTTVASSHSNSHAINKATNEQAQSTAEQMAFQREARGENTANLTPFMQRGNAAGDEINALLGLGGPAQVSTAALGGTPTPGAASGAPTPGTPAALANYKTLPPWAQATNDPYHSPLTYTAPTAQAGQAGQHSQTPAQTPAQAAAAAYDIFKQSTGYQTRLQEGQRTLSSNYFGGGVGQSGAAMKAALKYGQDYASNEFGNYIGYLGNQQGVGLSGASALAGVGQNYANNMSNISQNNANTASQAAIARAQNNGALFTGLAGIAGQTAGALSSYSSPNYASLTPSVSNAMYENPGIF